METDAQEQAAAARFAVGDQEFLEAGLFLLLGGWGRSEWRRGWHFRVGCQPVNFLQEKLALRGINHPERNQALITELGQNIQVDMICYKRRGIMAHSDGGKPVRDIEGCRGGVSVHQKNNYYDYLGQMRAPCNTGICDLLKIVVDPGIFIGRLWSGRNGIP